MFSCALWSNCFFFILFEILYLCMYFYFFVDVKEFWSLEEYYFMLWFYFWQYSFIIFFRCILSSSWSRWYFNWCWFKGDRFDHMDALNWHYETSWWTRWLHFITMSIYLFWCDLVDKDIYLNKWLHNSYRFKS